MLLHKNYPYDACNIGKTKNKIYKTYYKYIANLMKITINYTKHIIYY